MSSASESYAKPKKRIFANTEALDEALAQYVEEALLEAVGSRGRASLVVSGGSTPRGFFKRLADKPLPWQKIEVTLADERLSSREAKNNALAAGHNGDFSADPIDHHAAAIILTTWLNDQ